MTHIHHFDAPLKIIEEKSKTASKKGDKSLTEVVARLRSSCKIRKERVRDQPFTRSELRRLQTLVFPTDERAAFLSLDDLIDRSSLLPVPHTPFFQIGRAHV